MIRRDLGEVLTRQHGQDSSGTWPSSARNSHVRANVQWRLTVAGDTSMRQAESDLRHAGHARDDGDFDWAAFASHQAAEKAIKALFQILHLDAWGHMVTTLITSLPAPASPPDALVDACKELDKHYIPTRYPNGFERGAPIDFYTRADADRTIAAAEAILEFCRDQIGRHTPDPGGR